MHWEIKYHSGINVIETIYNGIISQKELQEAVRTNVEESVKHSANKFLSDCSNMSGGHTLLDLYDKDQHILTTKAGKFQKEAVIIPEEEYTITGVSFYATVCRNKGLNVKIFTNRDEALQWLMS